MAKPNVQKVAPATENTTSTSTSTAAAPAPAPVQPEAAAPAKQPKPKLSPKQKVAVKLGRLSARIVQVAGKFGGFSADIANGLEAARKWVDASKAAAEKLPDDFKAPSSPRSRKVVELAVGATVTVREKKAATYAAVLSADELKEGLKVVSINGGMVGLTTAKGVVFIARAHLKPVAAKAA